MTERSRPRRKSAALASVRLACANIADTPSNASPKTTSVSERRPILGETVYVWDVNWGEQHFEEGKVQASPAPGSKNGKFAVLFQDAECNTFNIPYKQSRSTSWTFERDKKVPDTCLAWLAKRVAKANKASQIKSKNAKKSKASTKAGTGGKGNKKRTQESNDKQDDESISSASQKQTKPKKPKKRRTKKDKRKAGASSKEGAPTPRRKQVSPKRVVWFCTQCQRNCACRSLTKSPYYGFHTLKPNAI